ncbi:DUF6114 domain-containing protein [Nocardioides sp. DS6]|uniref:DUF6114 domain-containing protein n=1 Tax=Nocardioides eburneus TaxID=3231482 RepID=A0ABV3SYZ7_9ACTN
MTETTPSRVRRLAGATRRGLGGARTWFRAWRRTRPFWGGLLAIAGGAWILRMMTFKLVFLVASGWGNASGYVLGGGMVLFGLVSWFAPLYRALSGLAVVGIALYAFVAANLGGYLVGTLLGIIGGSMIWAWGEKKPSRRERRMLAGGGDSAVEE